MNKFLSPSRQHRRQGLCLLTSVWRLDDITHIAPDITYREAYIRPMNGDIKQITGYITYINQHIRTTGLITYQNQPTKSSKTKKIIPLNRMIL